MGNTRMAQQLLGHFSSWLSHIDLHILCQPLLLDLISLFTCSGACRSSHSSSLTDDGIATLQAFLSKLNV